MTSANTTKYIIRNQSGEKVGEHHQSHMCRSHWATLLEFQPLEDHTIQGTWEDEDEEYHEDDRMSLQKFMIKIAGNLNRTAQSLAERSKFTYDDMLDKRIRNEFFFKDSEKHYAAMKKFVTDNFQ